jgi:hypothetical protein
MEKKLSSRTPATIGFQMESWPNSRPPKRPSDKRVQDKARRAIHHVAGGQQESLPLIFLNLRVEGSRIRSFSTVEFRDSPDCGVFRVCLGLM